VAKDEGDLRACLDCLATTLPATIRLDKKGKFVDQIRERIETEFSSGYPRVLAETDVQRCGIEKIVDPPQEILWYPERNGWRFGANKMVIRKAKCTRDIKQFLIQANECGHISRQEEASMIPPYFMDIQTDHNILDMCASPGSKTAQILEFLHRDDAKNNFVPPKGMVVANDVNSDRAYMMSHQLKRFSSRNLLLTSHPAQNFPSLTQLDTPKASFCGDDSFFDRILADVPCSGDGTIRKTPEIWDKFDPKNAMILHPVQLMIAQRGLELLKVGGLMVYSTCSLNPIENEAVVAKLLKHNKGSVELVDASKTLPLLKRRGGLSTWKVGVCIEKAGGEEEMQKVAKKKMEDGVIDGGPSPGHGMEWFDSYEKYETWKAGYKKSMCKIRESSFPPSAEEAASMNLERCMRIMPHDQNTSGFFICVLKKTAKITNKNAILKLAPVEENIAAAVSEEIELKNESGDEATGVGAKTKTKAQDESTQSSGQSKSNNSSNDAVRDDMFLPISEGLWKGVSDFYGIKDVANGGTFEGRDVFYWRQGGGQIISQAERKKRKAEMEKNINEGTIHPKTITFTTPQIAEILKKNVRQFLHVVNCGVIVFKRNERCNSPGERYRVAHSAMNPMLPQVTRRIFEMTFQDFVYMSKFCIHKNESTEAKSAAGKWPGVPRALLSENFKNSVQDIRGCAILKFVPEQQAEYVEEFSVAFGLTVWLGNRTVNVLVSKPEIASMFEQMKQAKIFPETTIFDMDVEAERIKLHQSQ